MPFHFTVTSAFRLSKQRLIFPLSLMTGAAGFSHVLFFGAGSLISNVFNRWSSSDTSCLVWYGSLCLGCYTGVIFFVDVF